MSLRTLFLILLSLLCVSATTQIGGSDAQFGSFTLSGTKIPTGAVGCKFTGNVGPTGAAVNISGWIKVTVDGVPHYVPYW